MGQDQIKLVMAEHGVEVGAYNPRHQRLLFLRQRGFGVIDLCPGLTNLGHLQRAEYRLTH